MTTADVKQHTKALESHIRKSMLEYEEVTGMMVKNVNIIADYIRQPSGELTRYFEVKLEVGLV